MRSITELSEQQSHLEAVQLGKILGFKKGTWLAVAIVVTETAVLALATADSQKVKSRKVALPLEDKLT